MILVTGGAGFVGLNVVEQLLARGEEVAIFDLNALPAEFKRTGKLKVIEGDTTDGGEVNALFSKLKIDRVIHLAAITAGAERDAREPRRIAEVNLNGTLNVLSAARAAKVSRFVHAGTGAIFGAAGQNVPELLDEEKHRPVPESMYGITKYAAERSCLRLASLWNLDLLVGRLATAYGRWEYSSGVRDRLSPPTIIARLAAEKREAVFPPLGNTDYIYAPDLASAIILLLDAKSPKHRLYHLGNGSAWALPRWCEALAKHYPGFRWRESDRVEECNVLPLGSGPARTAFSGQRIRADLGYSPRFDVEASAADFAAFLKDHGGLA
jgi:nucleoside-diphosphate-sugar epimerase